MILILSLKGPFMGEVPFPPFPIRTDPSCPPDEMFFMPPDVVAGLGLIDAAAVMKRHGIISEQIYLGLCKEVTDAAVQAAKEGREAMIANVSNI